MILKFSGQHKTVMCALFYGKTLIRNENPFDCVLNYNILSNAGADRTQNIILFLFIYLLI